MAILRWLSIEGGFKTSAHYVFVESQKTLLCAIFTIFTVKETHQWIEFLGKVKKPYFGVFWTFSTK